MTYSYTRISRYLTCPRRYRHRYLDGSEQEGTRAAMLFGRPSNKPGASFFPPGRPASPRGRKGSR
ncbi:hypothetical protein SBA1_820006 [Candidatus Sulfotelmatobacter kueseliae]|jgi:hypothetical protein|uniref:PD-(D/E)XK endonuclease-like domain-containing protein n=1 Tax=Candidatus Sulfotelmatobacter kueseliae TaxID=2042962 RepID=A0A2U3L8F6_9BACT|nr:hypothetical protein SBA1_820006 [Candidatus Sulfotelmatobacter kueseliae]